MKTEVLFTCILFVVTIHGAPRQNIDRQDPLAILQNQDSVRGLPEPDDEKTTDDEAFEFDMVLTPYQRYFIATNTNPQNNPNEGRQRKALIDGTKHWPLATIPYEMGKDMDKFQVRFSLEAMEDWEENTCIRFRPRSAALAAHLGHDDHIKFTNGTSCRTMVGRIHGGQEVSVGACSKGSIIHELGHTIGYVHEQSRPDRDSNVDIIKENIRPTFEANFQRYTSKLVSTYGFPYDFSSIMHYGPKAYSKNKRITVKTLDPHLQMTIGQREKPSFLDVQLANVLYRCSEHCEPTIQCQHDGYIGPNCTCVCPDGLTGDFCEQVATDSTCGGVVTAPSGTFQTPSFPTEYPTSLDCYWLIQGPPNSSIAVTFDAIDLDNAGETCQWCKCDYLELKISGYSQAGQRYCGTHVRSPILHNDSSLLLHFRSDEYWTMNSGLKFSYKIIS